MGAQSFACSAVTAQLHADRKNKGLFFFFPPGAALTMEKKKKKKGVGGEGREAEITAIFQNDTWCQSGRSGLISGMVSGGERGPGLQIDSPVCEGVTPL